MDIDTMGFDFSNCEYLQGKKILKSGKFYLKIAGEEINKAMPVFTSQHGSLIQLNKLKKDRESILDQSSSNLKEYLSENWDFGNEYLSSEFDFGKAEICYVFKRIYCDPYENSGNRYSDCGYVVSRPERYSPEYSFSTRYALKFENNYVILTDIKYAGYLVVYSDRNNSMIELTPLEVLKNNQLIEELELLIERNPNQRRQLTCQKSDLEGKFRIY